MLGPIIVLLVIFAPRGLVGYLNELVPARFRRRDTTPEPVASAAGSDTTKDGAL